MAAAFNPNIPVNGQDLDADPIRANFLQISTHHKGAGAPTSPVLGYIWHDDSDSANEKLKIYSKDGADPASWKVLFEHCESSPVLDSFVTETTVQTTDDTVTTIATIPISDDTVVWIEASIVGRRTNAAGRGKWTRGALVYRESAGAATMEGSVWTPLTIESDAAWDVTITVSGNNALIRVTGVVGHNLNWVSRHVLEERG